MTEEKPGSANPEADSPDKTARNLFARTLFTAWFCCILVFIMPVLILFFPVVCLLRRGRFDAVVRNLTYLFGRLTTHCSRPFLRIQKTGFARFAWDRPCILVCNHRSFVDIFMCSHLPEPTAVVVVRYWPSRIPVVGFFIRAGRYAIVEQTPARELVSRGHQALSDGDSMLFFPEGHRSRDGRLQPFQSGAFRVAAATGMPIVPVVLEGTENLLPVGRKMPCPARIKLTLLDPVDPAQFQPEKRALHLRRHVENIYADFLGEPPLFEYAAEEE
ncbi:MAG: lysophospholipid acyltransferase family protein [Candidatus Sumerlaeota bacterium]